MSNGNGPMSQGRKLHEDAARVAQEYKDIEDEVNQLRNQVAKQNEVIAASQAVVNMLTTDKTHLIEELDNTKARLQLIMSKSHIMGKLLMEIMGDEPEVSDDVKNQTKAVIENVLGLDKDEKWK